MYLQESKKKKTQTTVFATVSIHNREQPSHFSPTGPIYSRMDGPHDRSSSREDKSRLMALSAVVLVAMVLLTVPHGHSGPIAMRPLDRLQRGGSEFEQISPDRLALAALGDRLNCDAVKHRDCETEAAELTEVARRVRVTLRVGLVDFLDIPEHEGSIAVLF